MARQILPLRALQNPHERAGNRTRTDDLLIAAAKPSNASSLTKKELTWDRAALGPRIFVVFCFG